jgi:hypothetical protein
LNDENPHAILWVPLHNIQSGVWFVFSVYQINDQVFFQQIVKSYVRFGYEQYAYPFFKQLTAKWNCVLSARESYSTYHWQTHCKWDVWTVKDSVLLIPLILNAMIIFSAATWSERHTITTIIFEKLWRINNMHNWFGFHERILANVTKLCKIWGFHSGDYEERRLLGCDAVLLVRTDVSGESVTSIIRVKRFSELGTLAVTSNRSERRLPFLNLDIYRWPDGSLGHNVYHKSTHTNLYINAKSHHHPSNKQVVLCTLVNRARDVCDEHSLQARHSWCSWGTSSHRMASTTGRSMSPQSHVHI